MQNPEKESRAIKKRGGRRPGAGRPPGNRRKRQRKFDHYRSTQPATDGDIARYHGWVNWRSGDHGFFAMTAAVRAPIARRLLDIQEVATYTGLSVHTLYTMVSQRRIPFVKMGRQTKFDRQALDGWIEKHSVRPLSHHRPATPQGPS